MRRESSRRWAVVVAGTALVVAVPALLAARPVPAVKMTAQDVVAAALRSADVPHEGLAEIDASLGLPDLPVVSDATKVLSGTTRVRTWWASATSWRADTVTGTGEDMTYANPADTGGGVRQWSFETNTVTDVLYSPGVRLPRADDLLPPQVARRLLGWVGATDQVRPLAARRVAGTVAAGAQIVPADLASTVGQIDVWVEPGTGLPVEVDVYARGGVRPVFSSRFLDLALHRPAASLLSPTFSSTAELRSTSEPDLLARVNAFGSVALPEQLGSLARVTGPAANGLHGVAVYGAGLTQLVVAPLPDRLAGDVFEATGSKGRRVTLPGGQATFLSTPLVGLAVVFGRGQGYLVAGTLEPAALQAAVTALLAAPATR